MVQLACAEYHVQDSSFLHAGTDTSAASVAAMLFVPSPFSNQCLQPDLLPLWLYMNVCVCMCMVGRTVAHIFTQLNTASLGKLPPFHWYGLPGSQNWGPVPLDTRVRAHLHAGNISPWRLSSRRTVASRS